MNENDHEEHDDELEEFEGNYVVDDDTLDLLSSAVGCITLLASAQLESQARENLIIIAEELSERFMLNSVDILVEEQVHSTEDGEELIYKPRGGVFGDEPIEDDDAVTD